MNQKENEIIELLGLLGALTLERAIAKLKEIPYIPFPVSLATVDMLPVCLRSDNGVCILVGRKPGQALWQFLGGFRDPGETNEHAAQRELKEEGGYEVSIERFGYFGSMVIDDVRYQNSPHKITTTIYLIDIREDEKELFKAGDDIGEIQWLTITKENADLIRPVHRPLYEILLQLV